MIARLVATKIVSAVASFIAASCLFGGEASAQVSSTTYTYDALGRLTLSRNDGGVNDKVTVERESDRADNRVRVVTEGSSRPRLVVVPLNGFTVIPLPQ